MQSDELPNPESKIYVRVESHIDFPTQCLIMTLASGGAITNDNLKFRKVIEFQSSCILNYVSYIYIIVD